MEIELLDLKCKSFVEGIIFFERDFGLYVDLYAVDDDGIIYYRCKDAHEDEDKESKFEQIDILTNDYLKPADLDEFRDALKEANMMFYY